MQTTDKKALVKVALLEHLLKLAKKDGLAPMMVVKTEPEDEPLEVGEGEEDMAEAKDDKSLRKAKLLKMSKEC